MPPNHRNILEGLARGAKSGSDLRTQRTAVNHNQGEFVREFLGDFWEKISQVLCFTGFGNCFQENRRQFQAKSTNPPQNPLKNPPKIRRKIRRRIRQKIRQKIHRKIRQKIRRKIRHNPQIPPCKHAPSRTCDHLNVAVSLCHRSGLFWVFNRNQTSTFRCKIHSKIRQKKFALTLCWVSGSTIT